MDRPASAHLPAATHALLALLALLAFGAARADDGDPPAVAARLNYVQGAVSMEPAGIDQWADAVVNRPFTTGDRLWTDQNSRAELELGPLAIRLAAMTGFTFLNLDNSTVQMQVTAGTIEVHIPQLGQGQSLEIDTPALAVAVLQPGDYRIEVSDSGDSATVKVISGQVEVNGAGQTVPLGAQQQATFTETGGLTAGVATLGPPDEFDSWCFDRNRREDEARQAAARYVSPDMTGYEDLAEYGSWQSVPEYGYVWFPTAVPVGWAPYRIGHWVWINPWGWTWVDAQPWGFAPFHYGRWAFFRGEWCWVPGPPRVRPVYAPALVAWVGAGAAVTLSLSVGPSVAWFPLGPRDVYVPPYRVSNTYIRNVNVTNTTVINNTYITNVIVNGGQNYRSVNQSIPGAVTAVPRTVFTSAQPVAPHVIHVPPTALRAERVSPTPPPIPPARVSVLGAGAAAGLRAHAPPPRLIDRPVVALKIPPPAPVSFEKARQAIIANGGRPLPPAQLARLRPSEAPRPFRSARQPQAGGTGRFEAPGPGPGPAARPRPGGQELVIPRPGAPPPRSGPAEPFRTPSPPVRTERLPANELRAPPPPRSDRPPPNEFRAPPPARAARLPANEFRAPPQPRAENAPPREFQAPPPIARPPAPRPPLERPFARPAPPIERPRVEPVPAPLPPRAAPPHAPPPARRAESERRREDRPSQQ